MALSSAVDVQVAVDVELAADMELAADVELAVDLAPAVVWALAAFPESAQVEGLTDQGRRSWWGSSTWSCSRPRWR
jgi:hypothetical protein